MERDYDWQKLQQLCASEGLTYIAPSQVFDNGQGFYSDEEAENDLDALEKEDNDEKMDGQK